MDTEGNGVGRLMMGYGCSGRLIKTGVMTMNESKCHVMEI